MPIPRVTPLFGAGMIGLKTLRENLASFIFAGALLAIGLGFCWKYLLGQLDAANRQMVANAKTSARLEVQQEALTKQRKELAARQAAVNARDAAVDARERALALESASLSAKASHAQELAVIQSLIDDYRKLGVDVASDPPCGDRDLMSRYNQGRALLHEIASRAARIGESKSVEPFLQNSWGFSGSVLNPCGWQPEAGSHS